MCKVPMLVLDDLAREQKKDFDTDRCCAALDLIVSTRDAEHRPIWWTSNLQGAALDDRYGVALMRRLRRLNPELGPLGLNIMQ